MDTNSEQWKKYEDKLAELSIEDFEKFLKILDWKSVSISSEDITKFKIVGEKLSDERYDAIAGILLNVSENQIIRALKEMEEE